MARNCTARTTYSRLCEKNIYTVTVGIRFFCYFIQDNILLLSMVSLLCPKDVKNLT